MSYVLLEGLFHAGLKATRLADATCGTIRLELLKVTALVRVSVRRVRIAWHRAIPASETGRSPMPPSAHSADTSHTAHSRHLGHLLRFGADDRSRP